MLEPIAPRKGSGGTNAAFGSGSHLKLDGAPPLGDLLCSII